MHTQRLSWTGKPCSHVRCLCNVPVSGFGRGLEIRTAVQVSTSSNTLCQRNWFEIPMALFPQNNHVVWAWLALCFLLTLKESFIWAQSSQSISLIEKRPGGKQTACWHREPRPVQCNLQSMILNDELMNII